MKKHWKPTPGASKNDSASNNNSHMKCIILAAGYATRLYPLTENFPKPLLPIHGKPLIDHLLDDIAPEIDATVIVSNHKFAGHFQKWAEGRKGVSIVDDGSTSNEGRLGAVRDLALAAERLSSLEAESGNPAAKKSSVGEGVLVMAGDNLLEFSLKEFIRYSRGKATSCIMRYFEADSARLSRSAVIEIDDSDRVLSMEEKPAQPKSHWCCPPFYYYTPEALSLLGDALASGACGTDAPGSFAAWVSKRLPVHAFLMPGRRIDIGTLEDYRKFSSTK